jgi:hypothetical protein
MASGETGVDDVSLGRLGLQHHSPRAGYDDRQDVRDARNAGLDARASFPGQVIQEVAQRDVRF